MVAAAIGFIVLVVCCLWYVFWRLVESETYEARRRSLRDDGMDGFGDEIDG